MMPQWPGMRNAKLTMDYLTGMTYRQCGEKYGVHESRCHQIVSEVLRKLGLVKPGSRFAHEDLATGRVTAQEAGLLLRRSVALNRQGCDTPEAFYWEQQRELDWRNHGI